MIRVMQPFLDLILAVGERVSRIVEPEDADYAPARMFGDGESAPRGLSSRARGGRDRPTPH